VAYSGLDHDENAPFIRSVSKDVRAAMFQPAGTRAGPGRVHLVGESRGHRAQHCLDQPHPALTAGQWRAHDEGQGLHARHSEASTALLQPLFQELQLFIQQGYYNSYSATKL